MEVEPAVSNFRVLLLSGWIQPGTDYSIGRRQDIQAIHVSGLMILLCSAFSETPMSQAASGNRAVLVAASTDVVDGPCKLTVWKNKVGQSGFSIQQLKSLLFK